jgi:hypothetical protein
MVDVTKILEKRIDKNISLTDHTLDDLAELGHPYARRHGGRGLRLHDPYYQVHKQTGEMFAAKYSGTKPATIEGGRLEASAFVGIDESEAPHARDVILGTRKMIRRSVLEESKSEVLGDCYDKIKNNLRNMHFTFKGTK